MTSAFQSFIAHFHRLEQKPWWFQQPSRSLQARIIGRYCCERVPLRPRPTSLPQLSGASTQEAAQHTVNPASSTPGEKSLPRSLKEQASSQQPLTLRTWLACAVTFQRCNTE